VSKSDSLADEMMLDINMLGLCMVHCILDKPNRALIVPVKQSWSVKGREKEWHLGKEITKPNDFF